MPTLKVAKSIRRAISRAGLAMRVGITLIDETLIIIGAAAGGSQVAGTFSALFSGWLRRRVCGFSGNRRGSEVHSNTATQQAMSDGNWSEAKFDACRLAAPDSAGDDIR